MNYENFVTLAKYIIPVMHSRRGMKKIKVYFIAVVAIYVFFSIVPLDNGDFHFDFYIFLGAFLEIFSVEYWVEKLG